MAIVMLIRHGQASYGHANYDKLSDKGIEQATLLGQHLATLPIDAVFTGPLERQVGTAAAAKLANPIVLPGLAEFDGFDIVKRFMPRLVDEDPELAVLIARPSQGLADRAFKAAIAKWSRDEWQAEGLERVHEFAARVQGALDRIVATCSRGQRIAVVTSGGVIGVVTGLVFGATPHHMIRASLLVKNASITELKVRTRGFAWDPENVSLLSFNSVAHLPAALQTEV